MTEQERQHFCELYETHYEMVYRVCFSFMKNVADTEDAVAETFLKLMSHMSDMKNERHLKGWLVVTASNFCKNQLKHWWRKNKTTMDEAHPKGVAEPVYVPNETMEAIMNLPPRYKSEIYLYYYEGYNSGEIGEMLGRSASGVRNDLQKARKLLKEELQNGGISL